MINIRQKQIMEQYLNRLDSALQLCNSNQDKGISELYDLWAEISSIYSDEIPKVTELFDEIKEYHGLIERNSKALHGFLKHYIATNFNPLDEELVSNTRQMLNRYPDAEKHYDSALTKYHGGIFERNALDDVRLSLELLSKSILNNNRSLENNKSALGDYLKKHGVSTEIRNMFESVFQYYGIYQNEHVKHNDKILESELEYIIELTSVLMRFLIRSQGM